LRAIQVTAALGLLAAMVAGACYSPSPQDNAFICTPDQGNICPDGQHCDTVTGFCVKHLPNYDLGPAPRTIDLLAPFVPRTCDERITQGAISNLANLGAVNTAGDESSLSVSSSGQVYFVAANSFRTSALAAGGRSAPASTAVTFDTTPAGGVRSGSVDKNGDLWFSAANGANFSLYQATHSSATNFTVGAPQLPTTACAFDNPVFLNGDPTLDMYVTFPLGGCSLGPLVAAGNAAKDIGAFYAVTATRDTRNPSVLPSGTTMLLALQHQGDKSRLYFMERPDTTTQWDGPYVLPLGTLSVPSGGDYQAVVDSSCSHLYLVADRAGGSGGKDLWVTDIAPQ
jgi:hypothetical protein